MSTNKYFPVKWNAPTSVKTLITTRLTTNSADFSILPSPKNYDYFNLALHVGDSTTTVLKNREALMVDIPSAPYWLQQNHSNLILDLDNISEYNCNNICTYDGSITHSDKKICVVMTADCLPIFITDSNATFVSAVHAGWRGLLDDIISNAINMAKTNYGELIAYIGPSICSKHFEVKDDVRDLFVAKNQNYKQYFIKNIINTWAMDLIGIAKSQLLEHEIAIQNIYQSDKCTHCDNDLFYSYRKTNITGRFASLIWLDR